MEPIEQMEQLEQLELAKHRHQISADVAKLVERYRSVFAWDVPDIVRAAADKLILAQIRRALDVAEQSVAR